MRSILLDGGFGAAPVAPAGMDEAGRAALKALYVDATLAGLSSLTLVCAGFATFGAVVAFPTLRDRASVQAV